MLLPLRTARPCRSLAHRTVRFSRSYNSISGPHTTYFQPPPEPPKPPRRILRSILLGTTCIGLGFALGLAVHVRISSIPLLGIEGLNGLDEEATAEKLAILEKATAESVRTFFIRNVPPLDVDKCQHLLESGAGYSVTPKAVGHTCQLASNAICEDTWSTGAFTLYKDPAKDWCEWGIFDGHAGPRTAHLLEQFLVGNVGEHLWIERCFGRPYRPNDPYIINAIKKSFMTFDQQIIDGAMEHIRSGEPDRASVVALAAAAFSGSCALLALFDPVQNVLRVANTGDSRAVLGRWDARQGKYVAQPLSIDQTGFNEKEVARMAEQHPGEDVIDPKSGRVHGIAVSRAFGDARWKWPQEISKQARELFWGPTPRKDSMIKTPPYLTAEPEVMETTIQSGSHPDFLIMASDGLWDNMSNDDAVTCVQMFLDKYEPAKFLEDVDTGSGGGGIQEMLGLPSPGQTPPLNMAPPSYSSPEQLSGEEDDVYLDEEEKCLKWRVSPKHFVVEDENCGVHLIKNALGGRRRDLFTGIMSVQPPLSRDVRDDITVHVVFFGQDTKKAMEQLQ